MCILCSEYSNGKRKEVKGCNPWFSSDSCDVSLQELLVFMKLATIAAGKYSRYKSVEDDLDWSRIAYISMFLGKMFVWYIPSEVENFSSAHEIIYIRKSVANKETNKWVMVEYFSFLTIKNTKRYEAKCKTTNSVFMPKYYHLCRV